MSQPLPGTLIWAVLFLLIRRQRLTSRGRAQDRKRVAGGQDYEVRYEAKKTGTSKRHVKKAVKKVGNTRRKVERELRS